MKIAFAAALAAALFAIGCGTESTTTTTTTTTDTAVTADTAGDTAAGTDSTGADTTATDTAKTDTTKTDTTKDTAVAPKKCGVNDNACLQSCVTAGCSKEQAACTGDSKCFGLNSCLNACEKVELPTDPTEANCYKKCLDGAGQAATDKLYASQGCTTEKCIGCDAGDQNCQAACASGYCLEPIMACQADNDCSAALACATDCKDQTCIQGCFGKYPNGQQLLMGFIQCFQANAAACDM
jgi:hypothetical protein